MVLLVASMPLLIAQTGCRWHDGNLRWRACLRPVAPRAFMGDGTKSSFSISSLVPSGRAKQRLSARRIGLRGVAPLAPVRQPSLQLRKNTLHTHARLYERQPFSHCICTAALLPMCACLCSTDQLPYVLEMPLGATAALLFPYTCHALLSTFPAS